MPSTKHRPAPGFTLLELAIVLFVIGLIASMLLSTSSGLLDARKRETVRTQLNALDVALASFVAIHRRLPCPANGSIGNGLANAGVETAPAGTCNPAQQTNGVVPWVTLGLSESAASDPWGGRISYRVDPALTGAAQPRLMDMSNCDPSAVGAVAAGATCAVPVAPCAGSAACTSPISFLAGKGLEVWDGQNGAAGWAARVNNRAAGTGAAYVLISHGASGRGAYNGTGTLQLGVLSRAEERNAGGTAMVLPATMATAFQDAPLNDRESLEPTPVPPPVPLPPVYYDVHFDDYLSHPTIMAVLARAQLGPRAH